MGYIRGGTGKSLQYDSPILWAGAAWAMALLIWLLTPDAVVYYFVPHGRYMSISSVGFFSLCFIFFGIGQSFGMKRGNIFRPRGMLLRDVWRNKKMALRFLRQMAMPCQCLVFISIVCQIIHIALLLGGHTNEFDIDSVVQYRSQYRESAVQGLTILKFLSLPAFVMAVIGTELARLADSQRQKMKYRVLTVLSVITPITSGILGTRLIPLMWLVPFLYLKMGIMIRLKPQKVAFRKIVRFALSLVFFFTALYSAGHYVRYYARVQSGKVAVQQYAEGNEDFASYTFLTFLSYPFRTINNGMVIVDHIDQHTYFWRSFRWLYSGFGIERIDPGGLIKAAKEKMYYLEYMGLAYFGATNSSMPGYLFVDLGWFALLMFMAVGWFVGFCYMLWRRTALFGWVVLPLLIAPLLDSWRTDILFRSANMVALLCAVGTVKVLSRKLRRIS